MLFWHTAPHERATHWEKRVRERESESCAKESKFVSPSSAVGECARLRKHPNDKKVSEMRSQHQHEAAVGTITYSKDTCLLLLQFGDFDRWGRKKLRSKSIRSHLITVSRSIESIICRTPRFVSRERNSKKENKEEIFLNCVVSEERRGIKIIQNQSEAEREIWKKI